MNTDTGIVIVINPLICGGIFAVGCIVWYFKLIPLAVSAIKEAMRL